MSHAGLGLREESLYKGTLGAEDLGLRQCQRLHLEGQTLGLPDPLLHG